MQNILPYFERALASQRTALVNLQAQKSALEQKQKEVAYKESQNNYQSAIETYYETYKDGADTTGAY